MRIKSFNELRNGQIIKQSLSSVSKKPGVYIVWFDEVGRDLLLQNLTGVEVDQIRSTVVNGVSYWALYLGISSNLRKRLIWHINQPHSQSAVSTGFLSTLRQTISALLGINMSMSCANVDSFMSDHCFWEIRGTSTMSVANKIESNGLENEYYPLNLSKNKCVPKNVLKCLSGLRKKFKQ